MSEKPPEKGLAYNAKFWAALGAFQVNWAGIELITDYAISKFLNVTHEQGHLITSGMMFGIKARLLGDLISRSDHPNKAAMKGAFNNIRNLAKRNTFVHSYIRSRKEDVQFVDRASGGEYRTTVHTFTLDQMVEHARKVRGYANDFMAALQPDEGDVSAFADAALSLSNKSKMSPEPPKERD